MGNSNMHVSNLVKSHEHNVIFVAYNMNRTLRFATSKPAKQTREGNGTNTWNCEQSGCFLLDNMGYCIFVMHKIV